MNIRKGLTLPTSLYDRYASMPNERLLLATRTHPYTLFFPALGLTSSWTISSALLATLTSKGYLPLIYAISGLVLLLLLAILAGTVLFLLWQSHYYIVTSRKMIEIRGFPLLFRTVNDVLLDQVRCTEIDIRRQGVMHTLLNLGDINITFDRPTHQEEFRLADIHDPDHVGLFLGDMLEGVRDTTFSPVWYRAKTNNQYRFAEEIFPASFSPAG